MRIRLAAALGVGLAALGVSTSHAGDAGRAWDAHFPPGTQADIVFRATYLDGHGASHTLEGRRQGEERLRRTTDQALDLFVEKRPDGDYDYRLIDRSHHVLLIGDRTSLYRMGAFSDWYGLAHVLTPPRGEYAVSDAPAGGGLDGRADCAWKLLQVMSPASETAICWSSQWGLPMRIMARKDGGWSEQFSITDLRVASSSEISLTVDTDGLTQIDLRADGDLAD